MILLGNLFMNEKNQIKPIREAVRGDAFFTPEGLSDYAKAGLKGAAFGGAAGMLGGPEGALAGAATMGLWGIGSRGVDDIYYFTRSNEDKISWQAGDLQDLIIKEISPAVKELNPEAAIILSVYANNYKYFIDHYIRDKKTDLLQNNILAQPAQTGSNQQLQPDVSQQPQVPNSANIPTTAPTPPVVRALAKGKFRKIAEIDPNVSGLIPSVSDLTQIPKSTLLGGLVKGVKGLGVGTAADYATGKAYDYLAYKLRGGAMPALINASKRAVEILQAIDKIAVNLPPDFQGKIRSAGISMYQLLQNVQNEAINLEKQGGQTGTAMPPAQ